MSANGKSILLFITFLTFLALVSAVLFNINAIIDSFKTYDGTDVISNDINLELNSVKIDGETYMPRKAVRNYLIMGIDEFGDTDHQGLAQTDFIMILSFDSNNDTYTLIHINRDTMAEIDLYDYYDGTKYTTVAQLALSHVDGTYKKVTNYRKCENTAKAVSKLLYGIKFDGYVSMTMDAVRTIVDYIGGVPLLVEEDLTEIDERLVSGDTVMLDGDLALNLIRARGGLTDSSNVSRMKRQKAFLDAFITRIDTLNLGEETLMRCYDQTSQYMVAENGIDTFYEIFGRMSTSERGEIIDLPGEAIKGEKYIEFHVDEEGLKGILKDVFYEGIE